MAAKIYVSQDDVWNYYQENINDIWDRELLIAENMEYGIEIYLCAESYGMLAIEVQMDNYPIHDEIVTEKTCFEVVEDIYNKYLFSATSEFVDEGDEYQQTMPDFTEPEREDLILEREDDLDEALDALMDTFACNILEVIGERIYPEFRNDLKDYISEYLYRNWGVSIYRPMYLEDEDGASCYEEFPYSSMEFED